MEAELLEVERVFLPSRRSFPMRSSMALGVASGGGVSEWSGKGIGKEGRGKEGRGGGREGKGGKRRGRSRQREWEGTERWWKGRESDNRWGEGREEEEVEKNRREEATYSQIGWRGMGNRYP